MLAERIVQSSGQVALADGGAESASLEPKPRNMGKYRISSVLANWPASLKLLKSLVTCRVHDFNII